MVRSVTRICQSLQHDLVKVILPCIVIGCYQTTSKGQSSPQQAVMTEEKEAAKPCCILSGRSAGEHCIVTERMTKPSQRGWDHVGLLWLVMALSSYFVHLRT